VVLGTALGAVVTVLSGREPGLLLAVFMITATAVAVFAVRPMSGYVIIPVPALAYMVAAIGAGLIHDRAGDVSGALLAVNLVQWIASGFFAMLAATALAVAVAVARWVLMRRASIPAGPRRPSKAAD
jgi:hypothetical protein